jgi:serine/threonine-protein kinase 24/25/MST4
MSHHRRRGSMLPQPTSSSGSPDRERERDRDVREKDREKEREKERMAALEAKFPGRPAVPGMEHCKALSDLLYARWTDGLRARWGVLAGA